MRCLISGLLFCLLFAHPALGRDWLDSDADGVPDLKDACAETNTGHAVDASGCARTVLTGELCLNTLTGDLYPAYCTQLSSTAVKFDFAKSDLLSSQRQVLERVSLWLSKVPVRLLLIGHTDSVGSERFNKTLSLSRANSVKRVLVNEFNFSTTRFDVKGVGYQQPIADNKSRRGRALNRRVEFFVIF
ncbi:OmpA family protein [Shewanella gelidimarina]|uniref:OmpA family protein n=1 Tax=Shewanella gelidimarina TaxID=56813 RepID=UPI00200F0A6E|nr:OmpA family protein [Shewanella gelidimarina]MCL1057040.1 OmpA family protein [Shewanella gelidimarina]